jgi:hypothetical protein
MTINLADLHEYVEKVPDIIVHPVHLADAELRLRRMVALYPDYWPTLVKDTPSEAIAKDLGIWPAELPGIIPDALAHIKAYLKDK